MQATFGACLRRLTNLNGSLFFAPPQALPNPAASISAVALVDGDGDGDGDGDLLSVSLDIDVVSGANGGR